MRRHLLVLLAVLLTACGGDGDGDNDDPGDAATTATTTTTTTDTRTTATAAEDAALPLGDGKLSDGPQKGSLWSCQGANPNAPGASGPTPWIDTSANTWNPAEKPSVQGGVDWPDARFTATVRGDKRVLSGNRLPVDNPTGTFPIASSDPASTYDRNPNSISSGDVDIAVPAQPQAASRPSCVGFGAIGVLTDGSLLFNAVDAQGRDAPAHEVTDRCDGHPAPGGIYHHHNMSSCVMDGAKPGGPPLLVGWALDGFGIFVERDAGGGLPANDELDECHGRTSTVPWDGKDTSMYHYVVTAEYPYTIGCFRGTPVDIDA